MDLHEWWNLLFNHPSDEEENEDYLQPQRQFHPKNQNFFENVVLLYPVTDFKSHFRLEKYTYERLVQDLGPRLYHEGGAEKISPAKQIAIALWYFGNQEVYRSIADRFGVSKSTVWRTVYEVSMVLVEDAHRYIKWPERHEMFNLETQFRALHGFPGVIGAIDGSHIAISAPIETPDNYINRKGHHSIVLQGICDYTLKFRDVYTGLCGSVHDARVWRLSDVKELITQDQDRFFANQYHLLADSAYPLSNYMLTPFRDNGHLNHRQRHYNTKLAKTRVVIERAFGMLKGRFRKLKYIYMYNTEMIPLVILTCCILHNICIDNEDEYNENEYNEDDGYNEDEYDEDEPIDIQINNDMDGIMKREIISNLL